MIHQLFLPHESRIILGIPLSFNLPCDRLIWSKTPSGLFTTRSSYKLLTCDAVANNPSNSNSSPQKSFWRGIWMLRSPSKAKQFTWRACNDALPTMVNLLRRHIVTSNVCEVCKSQPEDILHAVWGCEDLEVLWRRLSWACHLLSNFLQVSDDYRAEIFIIMAWLLWNRRNNLRLGLIVKPLSQIISAAGGMLQDFLIAQEKKSEAVQMPSPVQWCPPALNQYKANFDGAVFRSCSAASLGVLIRNWRGAVIGALSMRVPLPQSVADVEALACRRAVMFAVEIGLREVIFEGDAAVVIQAINCGSA